MCLEIEETRSLSAYSEILNNRLRDICQRMAHVHVLVYTAWSLYNTSVYGSVCVFISASFPLSIYSLFLFYLQVVYYGSGKEAVSYFSRLGYECPLNYNPADYLCKLSTVRVWWLILLDAPWRRYASCCYLAMWKGQQCISSFAPPPPHCNPVC